MGKTFYSDYVSHALRFFCRCKDVPVSSPEADRKNWMACRDAVATLSEAEQEFIYRVYSHRQNVNDSVCATSRVTGHSVDELWHLVKTVERKVAENRGLI